MLHLMRGTVCGYCRFSYFKRNLKHKGPTVSANVVSLIWAYVFSIISNIILGFILSFNLSFVL